MTIHFRRIAFSLFVASICIPANAQDAPIGFGQLKNAPKLIPGGTDDEGRDYSYLGQVATNQKLILTASNGFFTKRTCTAKGESKLPKVGDEELIVPNFEHLDWKLAEGSLRWHIFVSQPGSVRFNAHLAAAAGGSDVEVSFAGQTKKVSTRKSPADRPQPWDLDFDVKEPGEYEISFRATKLGSGGGVGQLHRVDVFGPAIEGAHLLRVRWRPAAAHGGYDTTKVKNAKLLVFTTRSMAKISNYSPITTPFGYYGTTFENDGRSGGGFNFSMWGKEGAASDLKQMPHLLGVGSPEGEFSGFGHEGSGVKPRGWDPMPDRPELVIQALRLVPGEEYDSYFGYYFDHPTNAWKFFGAGKKWHAGKSVEHLKLGSFCEVPGPPQSERTGDVYREVRRRAWAYDGGKWSPVETYNPGGTGSSGDQPVNKSWYTTKEGEYAMGCGGIRLYKHKNSLVKPGGSGALPEFLTNPSVQNILAMPIQFGKLQATEVSANQAVIEFDIPSGGQLADGAVYFGTKDALTFAPRELHGTERKSELSQTVNNMAWEAVAEISVLQEGVNRVSLEKLKPDTTYFYRVLAHNDASRVWTDESHSFTTPKSGSLPIKLPPLAAEAKPATPQVAQAAAKRIGDEPYRIWTYSVGGTPRKIEGRLTAIAGSKIQIERKTDGKKGTMELSLFSEEDQAYIESNR